MKKLFLLLFLSVSGLMVAQDNFGTVKFGMYNPSASDAGFIIGYEGGWYIDDNFMVGVRIGFIRIMLMRDLLKSTTIFMEISTVN